MPARLKSAMSQYYAGLPGDYGRFRVVSQTYTRRTSRYEFMLSRVIVLILFYRFVGELSKRDTESESGMLINTCLFRFYRSKWNYYENKRDLHTLRGFYAPVAGEISIRDQFTGLGIVTEKSIAWQLQTSPKRSHAWHQKTAYYLRK